MSLSSLERLLQKRYRVVIVEAPYDQWENPVVQDLFTQLISMKFKGYRSVYPYGVMPVDAYDTVSTHHLVCETRIEKGAERLVPVMGYKTITLKRTQAHNMAFPPLAAAKQSNATGHVQYLEQVIRHCEQKKISLAYDGSWTMNPDVRKDKTASEDLKELMMAINVLYHCESPNKELIGFGLLRFKTEKFFYNFGYEPFSNENGPLEPFQLASLQNEPIVAMHLKRFGDHALKAAETYLPLWQKRTVISSSERNVDGELILPATHQEAA